MSTETFWRSVPKDTHIHIGFSLLRQVFNTKFIHRIVSNYGLGGRDRAQTASASEIWYQVSRTRNEISKRMCERVRIDWSRSWVCTFVFIGHLPFICEPYRHFSTEQAQSSLSLFLSHKKVSIDQENENVCKRRRQRWKWLFPISHLIMPLFCYCMRGRSTVSICTVGRAMFDSLFNASIAVFLQKGDS